MRTNEGVEPLTQSVLRQRLRHVDMRGHRQRMDARIGPARRMHSRKFAGHAMDRFLERLLHRWPVILPLPTHERPPVVLDRQLPASHGRIVPFGIAKPRSSSSTVIALLPARWTFRGRT